MGGFGKDFVFEGKSREAVGWCAGYGTKESRTWKFSGNKGGFGEMGVTSERSEVTEDSGGGDAP